MQKNNKSKKIIDAIQSKMEAITLSNLKKDILGNINLNNKYLKFGDSIKKLKNENFGKKNIAIIVCAGPSIKKNDQTKILKKYQGKAIIIATESSLYYLLRNDIFPDLIITLDPHPRILRWLGDGNLTKHKLTKDDYYRKQDLDIDFKDEIFVNKKIIELTKKFGNKLNIAVCTTSSNEVVKRIIEIKSKIYWWNPFVDEPSNNNSITRKIFEKNHLPIINSGGNVGSAAWMIADSVLGVKKIALLGMDFGYYLDTNLKNSQYYSYLIKAVSSKILPGFYKEIYNPILKKKFYTDYVYYWYKNCFLEMLTFADSKTYNCTGGGILFEKPLKLISLKQFCNRYLK